MPLLGEPAVEQTYALNFSDVDGNTLSTSDGHLTVVVLTREADLDKARLVGDRIPDYCIGDSHYRFITVISFEKSPGRATRLISNVVARRRLDAEAKRLEPRYRARQLTSNPRRDVFAVLDFDGTVATKLGIAPDSAQFQVLVIHRNGELLQHWTDVPTAEQLAVVVK